MIHVRTDLRVEGRGFQTCSGRSKPGSRPLEVMSLVRMLCVLMRLDVTVISFSVVMRLLECSSSEWMR